MCSLSSAGDKPPDSSAKNASSSSINNRVNEMNLWCKISNNSVLSISSAASGHQGQQSNVISTLSNSNIQFGYFSNRRCIAPSGQFENLNDDFDEEEES